MKCPHCGISKCIYDYEDQIERNAESYGSDWFHVRCKKCKKMVRTYAKVSVKLSKLEVSDRGTPDYN